MIGAIVEQAKSVVLDGGSLAIAFGPDEDGVRKVLASDENVRAVEGIATRTLGRPVSVRVEGGPPAPKLPTLAERAQGDPAVRRLVGEFGAHLVDVKPAHPNSAGEENA